MKMGKRVNEVFLEALKSLPSAIQGPTLLERDSTYSLDCDLLGGKNYLPS